MCVIVRRIFSLNLGQNGLEAKASIASICFAQNLFPGLPIIQFLIAYSIQKQRRNV